MPILLNFLKDKRIYIARPTKQTGTNKFLAATVTSAWCHIQPLTRERAEKIDGVFGKTYVIYADGATDVVQGDKLRDQDSNYYKVINGGVTRRAFGSFDHLEIIVERLEN